MSLVDQIIAMRYASESSFWVMFSIDGFSGAFSSVQLFLAKLDHNQHSLGCFLALESNQFVSRTKTEKIAKWRRAASL
jgi:hypothetical protein